MIIVDLFAFRTIGLREPDASSEGELQNFLQRLENISKSIEPNNTIQ